MKAITIHQHWADAIFDHGKDVENRSWKTDYRGELLIHAGSSKKSLNESEKAILRALGTPNPSPVLGAIIGKVELIDCVRNSRSDWAMPNQWHWVLRNPIRCLPHYCKGKLMLWEINENAISFDILIPASEYKQLSLF